MSKTLAEGGLGSTTSVRRLRLLLYGPPGTAKTVNAHRLPRTRTLDFDDGMQSVEWAIRAGVLNRRLEDVVYETITEDYSKLGHVERSHALDRAADQLDEWLAEEHISDAAWDRPYPKRWDTLIIDSGSALSDYCIWKSLDETARLKLSKSKDLTKVGGITVLRMQDWGGAASLFQKFINWCKSLDKNLVLICHEYVSEPQVSDDDSKPSKSSDQLQTWIEPLLIGQLRQKIAKDFDEVWYAHVSGSRNSPEYRFQTTPDKYRRLRSRLGCLDPVEPADFDVIKKKVAAFYNIKEDLLWTTQREEGEVREPAPVTRATKVIREAERRSAHTSSTTAS